MRFSVRQRRVLLSSLLALCCLTGPLHVSAASNSPTILIGEVQWSGSSRSTADEWLELWNLGDETVNLNGWSLVGASEKPLYFTSTQTIAAKQAMLIANYLENTDKTLLTTHVAVATSSLSLSNDHLLIELHDPTGTLQDTAGNGVKPPAGSSAPVNASMIRTFTSDHWNWTSAQTAYSSSTNDLGTPGICDGCLATMNSLTTSSNSIVDPISENTPLTNPSDPLPSSDNISPEATVDSGLLIDPLEAALYGITPAEVAEDTAEQAELVATTDPLPAVLADPVYVTSSLEQSTELAQAIIDATSTIDATLSSPTTTDLSTSTTDLTTTSTDITTTLTPNEPATTTTLLSSASNEILTASNTAINTPLPVVQPQIIIETLAAPQISEVMAAPGLKDTEWIELKLPDNATTASYLNWKLEVDGKSLFTFTSTNIKSLILKKSYLVLSWKSSRLKNAGAKIALKQPDNTIIQEVAYGASPRGTSWVLDATGTHWMITYTPTKGDVNIVSAMPTSVTKPVSTPTNTKKTSAALTTKKPASPPSGRTNSKQVVQTNSATNVSDIKTLAIASEKSPSNTSRKARPKTTAKTTPTAKKSAKKTPTKSRLIFPSTVTHFENMTPEQLSPRVRVRLQGVVGSTAGVFGKQHFVLLAPDGRGLLVKVTTQQPSPILGETIELTGLLFANDDGIQLQMESGDQWKAVNLATTSTPRLIDWNAPGIEDQWSLTRLEGLVTNSRAAALSLESDIGEVSIPIKAILGYRAQRIKPGDKIEVTGIFDGRNGTWKIQPSRASDILLLKHPEQEPSVAGTSSPSNTQLPWNAIGIAIGSIGAVEGIRRWLEKRRLTKLSSKSPLPQPAS